jgi:hypothetical protein
MFQFELGQKVKISISSEQGYIKGRAEYLEQGVQYQVHYQDSTGKAVTDWFTGGELKSAN